MSDFDAAFLDDDHRFHVGYLTEERADLEAAEALGLLELTGPSTIIDAGCGDGRLAVRLASLGHRVVAIDIDTTRLDRRRPFLAEAGVRNLAFYEDSSADVFQALRKAGKVLGLPTSLLIDGSGCELGVMPGPADWASEDAVRLVTAALGR